MAVRNSQLTHSKLTQVLRHLYFTSGLHYWEVMVENMKDPRGVCVGVVSSDAFETGAAEVTIQYVATGIILLSGVEVRRVQSFTIGDTVGVYLDMNAHKVAFFLNDQAQMESKVGSEEKCINNGETARIRVVDAGARSGMWETKAPIHTTNVNNVSWYSFQSRTMFAAIGVSSEADSLVVMRSEPPDGYR